MCSDLDKLDRLHVLFEQGALSESEYQREKARILSTREDPHTLDRSAPFAEPAGGSPSHYDIEESRENSASVCRKLPLFLIAIAVIGICGAALWFFGLQEADPLTEAPATSTVIEPEPSASAHDDLVDFRLPPKTDLLGKSYGSALQGRPFDPAAGIGAEGNFDQTLSGPQTPSIAFHFEGKEVLVWENCMAHNCPHARSIIGIEVGGPGRFVATIVDEQTEVLRSAWFGRELLSHCTGYTCVFDAVAQPMGQQSDIGPLTEADLKWSQGGASCKGENSAGQMVFYTEGEGAIRFKGRLRRVAEADGIGVGPWYSDEGFDSVEVNIEKRDGPSQTLEEGMSYPALLKVFDGEWTAIPVTMTCEA